MSGEVFAAVLLAAVLHATWNAIAKAIPDPRVSAGLFGAAGLVPAAIGVATLPLPDPASWPHLAVSSLLSGSYLYLLVYAYRYGEFGQVYPLARGLPPLLVTVVAFAVLGEELTAGQVTGVVVVSVALSALVLSGGPRQGARPRGAGPQGTGPQGTGPQGTGPQGTGPQGTGPQGTGPQGTGPQGTGPRQGAGMRGAGAGLGLAAAAGALIAAYTVVDGIGVRESRHALGYASWRMLVEGCLVVAASRAMSGPGLWRAAASFRTAAPGLLGGLLGTVAYAIVLWAQSRAPLALVSAVRETSLLFAGVIGTLVFGERFSVTRLAATVAAVGGMALLQLA